MWIRHNPLWPHKKQTFSWSSWRSRMSRSTLRMQRTGCGIPSQATLSLLSEELAPQRRLRPWRTACLMRCILTASKKLNVESLTPALSHAQEPAESPLTLWRPSSTSTPLRRPTLAMAPRRHNPSLSTFTVAEEWMMMMSRVPLNAKFRPFAWPPIVISAERGVGKHPTSTADVSGSSRPERASSMPCYSALHVRAGV